MASNSISIRVSDELYAAIEAEAEAQGLPIATFIKSALTRELRQRGRLKNAK